MRQLELSMRDLREDFTAWTVPAVLPCAGNRRADLHRVRPVMGDPLAAGAMEPRLEAPFTWTFWETRLDLPVGKHELAVRAWDSCAQSQPALAADVWNFKGYLCAAWHRVRVWAV